MRAAPLAAAALLLAAAGAAAAQPAPVPVRTELGLPQLGGVEVPAFGILAFDTSGGGRTVFSGVAELPAPGAEPRFFTGDTAVRIASVSKVVVALALHRLADAGRIALDDDVSRHLGWTLRNPAHPQVPVTIRQMMRHESSLSDAGGYVTVLGERLRDKVGPKSFSAAAPGTAFDYANLNQAILGEVIEAVTGERFDRAARRLVLEPLGLEGCFNWSGCRPETVAAGAVLYRKAPSSDGPWDPEGPWYAQVDAERPQGGCPVRLAPGGACDLEGYRPGTNGALFSPQGGLRISLDQLMRLGFALLRDDGFLKPETRASLFRAIPVKPAGGGAETDAGLMQAWSEGGLHCFSGTGATGGDQPVAPVPMAGCGHLGSAFGLLSGLVVDPAKGTVVAWALTGVSAPPPPGRVSRFSAPEEALVGRVADWLAEPRERAPDEAPAD